jgi:hypothetical protein
MIENITDIVEYIVEQELDRSVGFYPYTKGIFKKKEYVRELFVSDTIDYYIHQYNLQDRAFDSVQEMCAVLIDVAQLDVKEDREYLESLETWKRVRDEFKGKGITLSEEEYKKQQHNYELSQKAASITQSVLELIASGQQLFDFMHELE